MPYSILRKADTMFSKKAFYSFLLCFLMAISLPGCTAQRQTDPGSTTETAAESTKAPEPQFDREAMNAAMDELYAKVKTSFPEPEIKVVGSEVSRLTIPAPSLTKNLILQPAAGDIAVYLPPDYETSDKSYPVIYYLAGYEDSLTEHIYIFKNAMNEILA